MSGCWRPYASVLVIDCAYASFTNVQMLAGLAHLDCDGSHGVCVLFNFAESGRMAESDNWSPQQPPQEHTATITSNVYEQKKKPQQHAYLQYPRPISHPHHSAHKRLGTNSIRDQQQQLQMNDKEVCALHKESTERLDNDITQVTWPITVVPDNIGIFVRDKMSRDVITVGSTMRIPLLYRGEYSQWRERFMNYLEEQTDGEAMINSIQNGDHPLPVIAQVSLAGTAPNAPPTLKDPQFWTAEEKKNRKIDRLARSLLIQGLPNDIYSLIDSNDTAKDLWDALERQMRGSEYGEQDRKAAILYEYETFKATEGEQLLDTYLRYLQVINDLKKCGYKKDNCELNYKFLNNLQPEWKQYGTLMRQTKNLMDINIDALYNILKQNQGDVNEAMGHKKKAVVVTSDPLALVAEKTKVNKRKEKVAVQSESEGSDDEDISDLKKITALLAKAFNRKKYYAKPTNNNLRTSSASYSANKKPEYVKSEEKKEDKKVDEKKRDMSKVKCYNCKKEGHFAKDCKKAKVKDYNYYKTKMLLAKKDSDEQLLLAEDQAWMESSSDSDQEINANMVFMAKMENVLSDSEESSSSAEETIAEVSYYTSDFESESEYETSEYYDNSTNYGLFVNNDDDQEIFHDAIESASENFNENHIVSQTDHDQSEVDHNDSEDKDHLVDKLIKKFNHKIAKCQKRIEKANQQSKDLENQNKDLQDKYDVLKNQVNTFEEKNNEFNEQIKVLNETN
ncbi:retrovirus-related pol polyprotein from transposon TNT 1-94, partial [Tanacetum coccineum]